MVSDGHEIIGGRTLDLVPHGPGPHHNNLQVDARGAWPLQTWGSVYPRTGWTTQAEEPKAAAINAQRAGDIVTRLGQPHIYLPLTGPIGVTQRVWPPGPLVEKNHRTGIWQMLVPTPELSCNVFGSNDLASLTGWGGGRVDSAGDYAWNLWRPYKCCSPRG